MLPFLTDIDARAEVSGSRDPLGTVPLWTYFGRRVIGNLTTITTSLRGFTTLILGLYFAQETHERLGSKLSVLDLFLKFEQMAAYSRLHARKDGDFRGVDRVGSRLRAKPGIATLSERVEDQILSNQRTYGLWGFYMMPARSCGLVVEGEPLLTPAAKEFVEREYIHNLATAGFSRGRAIMDLLAAPRPTFQMSGRHAALASILAEMHAPALTATERGFYLSHLVQGGPTDPTAGLQSHLAELLARLPNAAFGMNELQGLRAEASKRGGEWQELSAKLEAIGHVERLLAPAVRAFDFILERDRQPIGKVAGEISSAWTEVARIDVSALEELKPAFASVYDEKTAERWLSLARAFSTGDFLTAIRVIIEINASTMQARNGASAWIRLDDSRISVRYPYQTNPLPKRSELKALWVHSYFMDSLLAQTRALSN
jgi:hypothetical protein